MYRVKHCSNSNICVIITTNEKGQITKQIITCFFFISSEIELCRNLRQNGTCSYIIFDEATGIHIYIFIRFVLDQNKSMIGVTQFSTNVAKRGGTSKF